MSRGSLAGAGNAPKADHNKELGDFASTIVHRFGRRQTSDCRGHKRSSGPSRKFHTSGVLRPRIRPFPANSIHLPYCPCSETSPDSGQWSRRAERLPERRPVEDAAFV